MDQILSIPLGAERTLGDIITAEQIAAVTGNVLLALGIIFVAMWLSAVVRRRLIKVATRNPQLDLTLFTFFANVIRYTILATALVFILNRFGIQTASIVAIIGAAGLAIGLAMQGSLSNIAAGVMLVIFRPFKIGDFVEVDGLMGTVKDISIIATELATLDNVQVIIPNSNVFSSPITNYSTYPTRRVEWIFGVSYGADLKAAEEIIRSTIMSDPRAHAEPEPFIQVTSLGDFSVDFTVRVWCDRADFFQFKSDMTRRVKEAFDEGGIDIPFPTRMVINSEGE